MVEDRIYTNNMGCMCKKSIEEFARMVLETLSLDEKGYQMKWTTASPSILIEKTIFICEKLIDKYPWEAKQEVLHEVAHIYTHPTDNTHGELFHEVYADLIKRFLGLSYGR